MSEDMSEDAIMAAMQAEAAANESPEGIEMLEGVVKFREETERAATVSRRLSAIAAAAQPAACASARTAENCPLPTCRPLRWVRRWV